MEALVNNTRRISALMVLKNKEAINETESEIKALSKQLQDLNNQLEDSDFENKDKIVNEMEKVNLSISIQKEALATYQKNLIELNS